MSNQQAMVSDGWEFHHVNGAVFITAEEPGKGEIEPNQIKLSAKAAYDLLEYLYQMRDELYELSHKQEGKENG